MNNQYEQNEPKETTEQILKSIQEQITWLIWLGVCSFILNVYSICLKLWH